MAYDENKAATLGQLKTGLERCKDYADAIVAALPEEFFLDQAKTTFVDSFSFSSVTYPGATDPNLDGKPVLVLAVKNPDGSTVTYSFLNMLHLVDTYTAADNSIVVSAKTIAAKLSTVSGNVLELKSDGLYVPTPTSVDISGKADKVTSATSGDFAALDSNGNLTDSGKTTADFVGGVAAGSTNGTVTVTNGAGSSSTVTVVAFASSTEFEEMMTEIGLPAPAAGGGD